MFGNNSIAISGNRGHGFEGEWGGVYGRVWREKRGGRNVIITLKYQKQKRKSTAFFKQNTEGK